MAAAALRARKSSPITTSNRIHFGVPSMDATEASRTHLDPILYGTSKSVRYFTRIRYDAK